MTTPRSLPYDEMKTNLDDIYKRLDLLVNATNEMKDKYVGKNAVKLGFFTAWNKVVPGRFEKPKFADREETVKEFPKRLRDFRSEFTRLRNEIADSEAKQESNQKLYAKIIEQYMEAVNTVYQAWNSGLALSGSAIIREKVEATEQRLALIEKEPSKHEFNRTVAFLITQVNRWPDYGVLPDAHEAISSVKAVAADSKSEGGKTLLSQKTIDAFDALPKISDALAARRVAKMKGEAEPVRKLHKTKVGAGTAELPKGAATTKKLKSASSGSGAGAAAVSREEVKSTSSRSPGSRSGSGS